MKANHRIVTLFAIVFSLIAGNALGQDRNEVLQGIKSVRVNISGILKESEKRSQLQTDVELKLRLAGIKVDPNSSQTLVVSVMIVPVMADQSSKVIGNYGTVQLSLADEVFLLRNPKIASIARTWQGSYAYLHGPSDNDNFWERCRDSVRDFTDEFINDYLSVNSK